MSEQKEPPRLHPDPEGVLFAFVAAIVITIILIFFVIGPKLETELNDAIADIDAEQIAEGESYTATVASIDISKGLLVMDNGDQIPIDGLSTQPATNDTLTYIKTFDYESSRWDGMPKRLDEEVFINIEIVGNTLTE